MIIPFYKFHGTGNDFILIDNRKHHVHKYSDNQKLIERLCNRHLGIGADGLILINNKAGFDFEMLYYNSNGLLGTMCGNGGRCAVAFANMLNISHGHIRFYAYETAYSASIIRKRGKVVYVSLQMKDVSAYENNKHYVVLDTGSPHYVCFVENLKDFNVYENGYKIRNSSLFVEKGINVNFVELFKDHLFVRTYERGVEDETLSCGTGVTASALAVYIKGYLENNKNSINVKTSGGSLKVNFEYNDKIFKNIFLEGPATLVFNGEIEI